MAIVYIDTSVALAHLLAEDRVPPQSLWRAQLVSSRLLEYEVWTRLNARGCSESHGACARELLGRIAFLELAPVVLARALEPFPMPVRTLDAMHLASADFLRGKGQHVFVATYDQRLAAACAAIGLDLFEH